jgi:predicted nucleic acid-binding Zn ribbon protein
MTSVLRHLFHVVCCLCGRPIPKDRFMCTACALKGTPEGL